MFSQTLRRIVFIGLFAIPFVPFLVSGSLFFPFIVTKAFAWRIIVEIIFAAWVLLALLDSNFRRRKSVILYAVIGFLLAIGLADLLGVEPVKSFWSNFERMEGFITLLHLGMFFAVISSVFKEANWKSWWNVSLVASFLMVLYCVFQLIGLRAINQGGVRVDGTLGNAIYLAVYMLFHIFISLLFMWREWKNKGLRWVYGLLILLQIFILYSTATRGAILGLLGGLLVIALLNIRNKNDKVVRKTSIAIIAGLVLLVGGFVALKDSAFIQKSPVLARFASLNTEELKSQGRYFVWPMALEGVKERPIFGWGQENFSYVFQEHYSPDMYQLEPWFDRAHNIFLDWAVAGGIVGLISYLFLYIALLFSLWWKSSKLSHAEKSIITGLVAAYFFHNFFVFDHLISYILFFSLLAYIHSQSEALLPAHGQVSGHSRPTSPRFSPGKILTIALPVVSVLLILALYCVNIKPLSANSNLIRALRYLQPQGGTLQSIEYFKKAYGASRLGRSEVVEHISANASAILTSDIKMEEKNAYFSFAKGAVLGEMDTMEGDARFELSTGSFLASVGMFDEALVYLERAKDLMPGKQQIYFEIGAVYINKGEMQKALEEFKVAYEMAPEYKEAKAIYLLGAIYAGDKDVEKEMIGKMTDREIIFDDRIVNAYKAKGRLGMAKSLLEGRIKLDPENEAKYRQSLEALAK